MDPYKVLGLQPGADISSVKQAYKFLASKYDPMIFDPSSDEYKNAQAKMDEINKAYDEIIMNSSDYSSSYSYSSGHSSFSDIRNMINSNRLDDAQMLLDGVPEKNRNAEWYYLKGLLYKNKGWIEQARNYYQKAYNMDPGNKEYKAAYRSFSDSETGGYRTNRREESSSNSGCLGNCSACDICSTLLCADCCCECMGGDLIRCC